MNTGTKSGSHEELLMLYQITVGDLSSFKTTQWTTTNYAFLLFAGIVGVRQFVERITPLGKCLFVFLVWIVVVGVLVILQKLQDSIVVRQARLKAIRPHFSGLFNQAWEAKEKKTEFVPSIWVLRVAVLAGAMIVSVLLLLA